MGAGGAGPASLATIKRGSPVEVGVAYAKNAKAFGDALGGAVDLGNGRAQNDDLITYINSHGGLAGHPIKPVYYEVDLARTDPWSTFVQEACALWTEDHHVIAASFPVNIDIGQLATCLRKHGAILDASSLRLRSQSDYDASPLLVEPWMITAERLAPLYVKGLQQQGYFSGKPTIGLLSYDYPQAQRFAKLIGDELAKIGETIKITFVAQYADSTSGLGSTIAQIQSAVLKFRSAGVTHVMSSAIPGGVGVAFLPAAKSQHYYPRYGLTSFDAISGMPADQMVDALAVGWWLHDVDAAHEIANPTTKLCRKIFAKNGSASTRSQELLAFAYCDFLLLLDETSKALDPAAPISGAALARLLDRTGPSYASSRNLATVLTSARRDGASGLRPLRFDGPCACWVYPKT
ncbi:MAG: ABC transporter substrate-binding protein [Actinomycetota bacterium]|nr:ABC transporter substrate-binding protein [Actinomycetota bacterium]